MKLQPLDIRRQTFTKSFRGYEPAEVDAFLKQVADQQAALLDELRQAEDRLRETDGKLRHYERVELALQEALETARETGKRAEEAAERESRATLAAAEARAAEIVRDAERERFALRQDTHKLSSRQAEIAARLRGFLLSELEILAQFQGDDPIGFIKLQPAASGAGSGQAALPPASEASLPEADAPESGAPEAAAAPPETTSYEAAADDPAPPVEPPPVEPPPVEPAADLDAPASESATTEGPPSDAPPAFAPLLADPPPGVSEPGPAEAEHAPTGPAVPSWDLRSLVTGAPAEADGNVAGSEAERERIRRILDELD